MPNDELPEDQSLPQIIIEPDQMAGVWANFARVNHSRYEFTVDFVRMDYGQQPVTGIVVARVSVSPLFITQLIDALQTNWSRYAEKTMPLEVFGEDEPDTSAAAENDDASED
jgi:hypothetical protein